MYSELDDTAFILRQFADYVGREPTKEEILVFLEKLRTESRRAINDSFAYCDETVQRARRKVTKEDQVSYLSTDTPLKVAIILCGHLRTFESTYRHIRNTLVLPFKADVFVHTWDLLGMQKTRTATGPVPGGGKSVSAERAVKLLPEIKKIQIGNNDSFISRAKIKDKKAFLFGVPRGSMPIIYSAKPVYIESQLYSLYRSFQLLKEHEQQTGTRYDLIIKMRSDMAPLSSIPDLGEFSNTDIFIPSPPNNHHDHPFCFACERGPHEGQHASDICDTYAYGGREGMEYYCNLWENLEDVFSRMTAENAELVKNPKAVYRDYSEYCIANIWQNAETHHLHCFYPERIFRMYLEGHHLRRGTFSCKIIR